MASVKESRWKRWPLSAEAKKRKVEVARLLGQKWRRKALERLGCVCVGCGCREVPILTFDHIEGNGAGNQERQSGRNYASFCKEIAHGQRPDIRCLCWNCQNRAVMYSPDIEQWPEAVKATLHPPVVTVKVAWEEFDRDDPSVR